MQLIWLVRLVSHWSGWWTGHWTCRNGRTTEPWKKMAEPVIEPAEMAEAIGWHGHFGWFGWFGRLTNRTNRICDQNTKRLRGLLWVRWYIISLILYAMVNLIIAQNKNINPKLLDIIRFLFYKCMLFDQYEQIYYLIYIYTIKSPQ